MRTRYSGALMLSIALVTSSCSDHANTAAPPGPRFIVNGSLTGAAFPAVGALMFDYNRDGVLNGDDEWCTGSLISPTVFLTAAHCVVTPYTPPGSQFYVSFAPDLYARSIRVLAATGYRNDPQYGHDQANLHDLAVVFLNAKDTKGITPLRLPTAGYLDRLSAQGGLNNAMFLNVGYGTSASKTGPPSFPFYGTRSVSQSPFMGLQPTWLGLLMNTAATGEGGDCYGDSGGPKFLESDPTTVLATVTTGDYPCRATTWDWRTDTPEARGFLGQFVTLP